MDDPSAPSDQLLLKFVWEYLTNKRFRDQLNQPNGRDQDNLYSREQYFERLAFRLDDYRDRINQLPFREPVLSEETAQRLIVPLLNEIYTKKALDKISSKAQGPNPKEVSTPPAPPEKPVGGLPPPPKPKTTTPSAPQKPPPYRPEEEELEEPGEEETAEEPGEKPEAEPPEEQVATAPSQPSTPPRPPGPTQPSSGPQVSMPQPGRPGTSRIRLSRPGVRQPSPALGRGPIGVARSPGIIPGLGSPGSLFPRLLGGLGGLGAQGLARGGRGMANALGRLSKVKRGGLFGKGVLRRLLIIFLISIPIGAGIIGLFFSPTLPSDSNRREQTTNQVLILTKASLRPFYLNGEAISYFINISNRGNQALDLELSDIVPEGTEYIDNSTLEPPVKTSGDGKTKLVWQVKNLMPNETRYFNYDLKPKQENFWIINQAQAKIIQEDGGTSQQSRSTTGVIDLKSGNLDQIFQAACQNANIPCALLKAIGKTESAVLSYSNEEVVKFSTPLWWEGKLADAPRKEDNHPDILRGYGYNTCQYRTDCPRNDVRGALQFELNTWEGIKPSLKFADSHDPDRRNLTDIVYGAAILIRQNAEYYTGKKEIDWNEEVVKAVARMYCAGPAAGRDPAKAQVSACQAGGSNYDDLVVEDYKKFSAQST